MSGRKDNDAAGFRKYFASELVNQSNAINCVAKHFDSYNVLFVRRMNLNSVATYAEVATTQRDIVSAVLKVDHATENAALVVINPHMKFQKLALVFLRVTHAVDARHTGHHNRVGPCEQSCCCRVA